jgi:membrane associated rhomboid family serine protease
VKTTLTRTITLPNVPTGNYIIMLLASVTFMLQFVFDSNQQYLRGLILEHWSLAGVIGHMWLHVGTIHIVSNLVILWIFGRHVCRRIGSANYILAYVAVGLASAVVHIVYDGRPTIGASGAIMGILGLHVVLCFEHFSPLGPWLILVWYLLNLTVGVLDASAAAHFAHIGGFLSGAALAGCIVLWGVLRPEESAAPVLP